MRRTALVAVLVGLALVCASPAFAGQDPVIADCSANQQLTASYTVAQLQGALRTMSPTTKEYTNCYDVITRALQSELGTAGAGNGVSKASGGSFLPTWVIVVLIVLVAAAGAYAVLAYRARGTGGDEQ
jgi:hypothetical protein